MTVTILTFIFFSEIKLISPFQNSLSWVVLLIGFKHFNCIFYNTQIHLTEYQNLYTPSMHQWFSSVFRTRAQSHGLISPIILDSSLVHWLCFPLPEALVKQMQSFCSLIHKVLAVGKAFSSPWFGYIIIIFKYKKNWNVGKKGIQRGWIIGTKLQMSRINQ